jgi:hypothetical protein
LLQITVTALKNLATVFLGWAGHVARMGEEEEEKKKNTYRLMVRKPEGRRPL